MTKSLTDHEGEATAFGRGSDPASSAESMDFLIEETELAKISLHRHRRRSRFARPLWSGLHGRQPDGKQIPLRHLRDQYYGVFVDWFLPDLSGTAHRAQPSMA